MAKFSFSETITKLQTTPVGKEAAMYGPIRDLFIHVLGYPASDVDIDILGEGGRPDVTVRAPGGFLDAKGREAKVDWLVVEAKDACGCFLDPVRREAIFEVKSKYIGTHTAWFVMVEPTCWIARPVGGGDHTALADVVVVFDNLSDQDFLTKLIGLKAESAGVSKQLEAFRSGDLSMIAIDKLLPQASATKKELLRVKLNRKRFFKQVRESTLHLQSAVAGALARLTPDIDTFSESAKSFWQEFGKADDGFDEYTLRLRGEPNGPDESRRHDRELVRLKKEFSKAPHVARLAVNGLPQFQSRTGVDDDKLHELLSIETANLILARVLLLRFFEDHGFFGDTKYVCNGGIDAFQKMRSYFKESYSSLLEHAYKRGSKLFATAFESTELDWIFGSADEALSSAIELTLFRFARYDFTTIRGDILTGLYDRFMDRDQRKKLGEFYTPPSIARYIIRRMGVTRDSRVIDPACGSGTFLIESYREMVGDDLDRGAADFQDILDVFARLAGNDLNTFSAVLTQIQLLWQILAFKDEIESQGFPDILVTAKVNSLVERDHWCALDRFSEIDVSEYDAVVGNPPYVRSERSAQALDKRSQKEFERGAAGFRGVSSKLNAYALFLYRALARWARPARDDSPPGKVGFVLPVSLFDSNENAHLRSLFAVGGRWTIREIVDLEVIYRQVFDADVLPAILIAENRSATHDDQVFIRFADASCVNKIDGEATPDFDLEGLEESLVAYCDLFSPDGRILTRVTPQRLLILRKLWALRTFNDIAKPFWVHKKGSKIDAWTDKQPSDAAWEERRLIAGGIAFRGSRGQQKNGPDVFKGENIVAAELQGSAVLESVDLQNIDDASLWRYADILPPRGLAVARVAHCPNGVMFDPTEKVFTNTATILFPRDELCGVPFDLLLLSNVYVWFYALAARMGILRTLRSDVYPTNLGFLPWDDAIATRADELEAIRDKVIVACAAAASATESCRAALAELGYLTVKSRLKADKEARMFWGENFASGKYEVEITELKVTATEEGWQVSLGSDASDFVGCNKQEIAEGISVALQQKIGESITKSGIFNMPVPVTQSERDAWDGVVTAHQEGALSQAKSDAIAGLDEIVGRCLGLDSADIQEIRRDLAEDPFLRGIRPRYPGTITRKQGFRTGLDSSGRYQ